MKPKLYLDVKNNQIIKISNDLLLYFNEIQLYSNVIPKHNGVFFPMHYDFKYSFLIETGLLKSQIGLFHWVIPR